MRVYKNEADSIWLSSEQADLCRRSYVNENEETDFDPTHRKRHLTRFFNVQITAVWPSRKSQHLAEIHRKRYLTRVIRPYFIRSVKLDHFRSSFSRFSVPEITSGQRKCSLHPIGIAFWLLVPSNLHWFGSQADEGLHQSFRHFSRQIQTYLPSHAAKLFPDSGHCHELPPPRRWKINSLVPVENIN